MVANNVRDPNTLYCSFCGKSQHDVKKLIAGPNTFICNECVELCNDIMVEEARAREPAQPADDFVKKGRDWLIQTHRTQKQEECDKMCHHYDSRVTAGLLDDDARLLGYVEGLRIASQEES